ncbi:MAG: hypothetical protein H6617_01990 [Bdellovibrionaceae bacterium]|nr:hypothetical protein [Pseudobdellovibrionaceae bacterium]
MRTRLLWTYYYEEDRDAAVDINVVMNRNFEFNIEVTGTAESTHLTTDA